MSAKHITEAFSPNNNYQSQPAQNAFQDQALCQLQEYHAECKQRVVRLRSYIEKELAEPATVLPFITELSEHCEYFFNKSLADKVNPAQLSAFQQGSIKILKKLKTLSDAYNNLDFTQEITQAAKHISRQHHEPLKDDQPRDLFEAACYLATLEEFRGIMGNVGRINDAIAGRESFRPNRNDSNLAKLEGKRPSPPLEKLDPQSPFGDRATEVPYSLEERVVKAIEQHPALKNLPLRAAVIADAAIVIAGDTVYKRFIHQQTQGMSDNEIDAAKLKDIRANLTSCLFAPLTLALDRDARKPTLTASSQEQLKKKINDLKKYIVRQQYEIAQIEYGAGGAEGANNAINALVQLYAEKILSISKVQITGDNLPEIFEALLPTDPATLTALKEKLDPLASLDNRGQKGYVLTAFCTAVNAKRQELSLKSTSKPLSQKGTKEREKTLGKIAPVVKELKKQGAMKPVLDAFKECGCDVTKLRLIAYFKEEKLYASMPKNKYLLLTGRSDAMMEWLGYPIPEGKWQKAVFALSFLLPHRLIKLIFGSAAYWCGVVHERGLRSDKIGYLPWAICTGFYLLLRAVFLPVKSWQAAANYSKAWYICYPLMVLSGLITIASWSVVSVFALPAALPLIIQGIGLVSSSAAAAVSSFFASVTSYVGSWLAGTLGVGIVQAASAAVGGAMALSVGIFRAGQSLGGWLGSKLQSLGRQLQLSWRRTKLENKMAATPSVSKQAVAVTAENSTHSSPGSVKKEQPSTSSSQPTPITQNVGQSPVPATLMTSSSSSMPGPYARIEIDEDPVEEVAPYSIVALEEDQHSAPSEVMPGPYGVITFDEELPSGLCIDTTASENLSCAQKGSPTVEGINPIQKKEIHSLLQAVLVGNAGKVKAAANLMGESRKGTPFTTPEPSPRSTSPQEARTLSPHYSVAKAKALGTVGFFSPESKPTQYLPDTATSKPPNFSAKTANEQRENDATDKQQRQANL